MKNKLLYISICLISVMFMGGCDDKLELEPAQSLSVNEAIGDFDALQTALYGAYDGLQDVNYYGRDFVVIPEVGGDNVYISINNSNRFLINYRYELNASATQGSFWNDAYNVILRANNIINNIENVEGDQTEIDQVLGEALAIRALAHFDLVRTFGLPYSQGNGSELGVPIVLESKIDEPARNTVAEVYTQVVADLTAASPLLTQDVGPFRITKSAVDALLARVYLYMGNWAKAESSATAAIGGGYSLTAGADLEDFFTSSGNDEEIFTLKFQPDETRGSDNLGQIYNPAGYGDIRVTNDIMSSYESGDARTNLYYDDGGEYYVGKFLGEEGIPGLVSYKVIRLAEMYLIRAEARANQNKFTEAIADVNVIRDRAGASLLTGVSNGQVLNEVYAEKNREFAFEGHRTFDLWRTGRAVTRSQCNTGLELNAPCLIEANSKFRAYPIPQAELDVNQNMVQNPGY